MNATDVLAAIALVETPLLVIMFFSLRKAQDGWEHASEQWGHSLDRWYEACHRCRVGENTDD